MSLDWGAIFGLTVSPLELVVRGTAMYLFLFLIFRVVVRRRIGAVGMADILVSQYGGEVPASMDALVALPGVGRKTANVVLGHALGVPGLPVDRHVLRVTNRLGLVHSDDPIKVEAALGELFPKKKWTQASDTFILHGRRICKPTPLCKVCNARPDCDYASR